MQSINRFERRKLRDQIRASVDRSGSVVLCTLISKQGPFYRPLGFQCVILNDGKVVPFFAGSCTDRLVGELAKERLEAGKFPASIVIHSGSEEDATFGSGSGCGGRVEILCELLTAEDLPKLDLIVGPDHQSSDATLRLILTADAGGSLGIQRSLDAENSLRSEVSEGLRFSRPADPAVWIVGGADDAFAVAHQAINMGWWVGLVDHRKVERGSLPIELDEVHHIRPSEAMANIFATNVHIILMSHNLEIDQQWLRHLAFSPVASVGLLGPVERCERLLQSLTLGEQRELVPKLRKRTGIAFRSRSPELLAIGIMAELQAMWENSASSDSV